MLTSVAFQPVPRLTYTSLDSYPAPRSLQLLDSLLVNVSSDILGAHTYQRQP